MENFYNAIIGFIIIWLLLSVDDIYEYFSKISRCSVRTPKNWEKKQELIRWLISRLFSILLFSIPVIISTINGSDEKTFCLMNRKEPICKLNDYVDCFKDNSDFSAFLQIGNRFYIFRNDAVFFKPRASNHFKAKEFKSLRAFEFRNFWSNFVQKFGLKTASIT